MSMTPQDVVRNLGELPPLPQVALQAVRLSADSDSSTRELQDLIRTDQALSAQLLKIANSAMFGRMREVATLTDAILTLGFSTSRSVVIASSVKNLFSRGPTGVLEQTLWEHALATAITGSAFSRALQLATSEEIFVAGLLHDIGKNVLTLKFPEAHEALLRRFRDQGGDGLSMELATFGFDHAMVGEALLGSWNLAEGVQAGVRWHHNPIRAPREHRSLVALVALGNQVAIDLQIGIGNSEALVVASWEAMGILGLDEATYQAHRTLALDALERDRALLKDF
jgi:putative nucleotidyltransferase with HDIG domain